MSARGLATLLLSCVALFVGRPVESVPGQLALIGSSLGAVGLFYAVLVLLLYS